MGYIEAIKEGFRLVNRVWQLVLIQLSMMFISGIGFFVFVGIPLAVAFILFSIDLTGITEKDIFQLLKEPSEIISKYFGIVLFVIFGLLIYFLAVITFSIYVFGGSVGVIGRAIENKTLKFSMHLFFSLILILFLLTLFLGILSITIYGTAVLCIKGIGSLKSLKDAFQYIMKRPQAFWLYLILFGGYILISFILVLLGYPFKLIPVIGAILSFPYQLISYVFQTYVGLEIIATIFIYYYSTEIHREPVVESSTPQVLSQDKDTIHDS